MSKKLKLTLKVWRQNNADDVGRFETYLAKDVDEDMSFLEMLDVVNEGLIKGGKSPFRLIATAGKAFVGPVHW